jgi:hypothetical protein
MILHRNVSLPEKYTKDNYQFVYLMAMLGSTQEMLAEAIGVEPTTVASWRENDPLFAEAWQRGELDAKLRVLNAFYDTCIGYYKEEEVTNVVKGAVVVTKVNKWHAGNPWAQARFLSLKGKNEGWSETQPAIQNNTTNINFDVKMLTTEQLMFINDIQKAALKSGND